MRGSYRSLLVAIVEEWCKKWGMTLYTRKTKIMHFRKKLKTKSRSRTKFVFQNEEITYTAQYKYLGVVLTEHLEWDLAFLEVHKKASRVLALLNHRARICGGFHTD